MTEAAGVAALEENAYYMENVKTIIRNREWTSRLLRELGFTVLDSKTNFIFAASDRIDGETLYRELKKRGVLVRHFTKERIAQFNRITIGTKEQMEILIRTIREILGD
jgi:histidinol-phosphate aminotransferase